MGPADRDREALARLRAAGRSGAGLFAICCIERLRPLLDHVPSGAPVLVAGVSLTQLWRVLEGAERPDPRRLAELSNACWSLVEVEPAPRVPAIYLELLAAGAHDALETYLSGDPQHAIRAAQKACEAASHAAKDLLEKERASQDGDLQEISAPARAGAALPQLATRLRQRAEGQGKKFVEALLEAAKRKKR
ncbi:MAG TPA: hypothetical protein VFL36_24450 [Myxococcales bacterium]|nr:hypothetical protein [Myxococcales bacterium]